MRRQLSEFGQVCLKMTGRQKIWTGLAAALMVGLIGWAGLMCWSELTGKLRYASDLNYCGTLVVDEEALVNWAQMLEPEAPGVVTAEAFWREEVAVLPEAVTDMEMEVVPDWLDDIYRFKCSLAVAELKQMYDQAVLASASETIYWRTVSVEGVGNFYVHLTRGLLKQMLAVANARGVEVSAIYAVGEPERGLTNWSVKTGRRMVAAAEKQLGWGEETAVLVIFGFCLALAWLVLVIWKKRVYKPAKKRQTVDWLTEVAKSYYS